MADQRQDAMDFRALGLQWQQEDKKEARIDARATVRSSLALSNVLAGVLALALFGFAAGFIIVGEQDTASACSIWLVGYGVANIVAASLLLATSLCCNLYANKELVDDGIRTKYDASATTAAIGYGVRAPLSLWTVASAVFFIGLIINVSSCTGAQHDWAFFALFFSPALALIACVAACAGFFIAESTETSSRARDTRL